MNKNILHVVNIYFVIPYFLGDQLSYFRKKGYREHIICSSSEQLKEYSLVQGFEFQEMPVLRKISLVQDLKTIIGICKYIRKNQINIVCGHTPKGGLLAMIAAFLTRVPKRIYFRHGLVYETSTGIKRWILVNMERFTSWLATDIVCVSLSVFRESAREHLNPVRKQRILFKGTCNGIETGRFCQEAVCLDRVKELRECYSIRSSSIVIGFSGRLVKDKGIIELVEAFQLLQAKYTDVVLLLVGMLEERNALPEDTVEKIKRDPRIIYTGYVDNRQIENYYALMDIFVLPSYREGFPTSVLEASSMQLPVITTRVTGCVDAIIENETGIYAENNVESLRQAIERLIQNKNMLKRLGENGRQFVIQNFGQHLVWDDIEKLYRE